MVFIKKDIISRGNGHQCSILITVSYPICDEVVSWAEETPNMKFEVDPIPILKYAKSSSNGPPCRWCI